MGYSTLLCQGVRRGNRSNYVTSAIRGSIQKMAIGRTKAIERTDGATDKQLQWPLSVLLQLLITIRTSQLRSAAALLTLLALGRRSFNNINVIIVDLKRN